MSKPRRPEDLTIEELRRLLVEKSRKVRQQRLERYRKTGRLVILAPDLEAPVLEDLQTQPVTGEAADRRPPRRRWLDRFLLLVEVLAVVGLFFVLFNGLNLIRELNQEFASALVQPTFTPTPLITAVVLPSGHTPPTDPGGARPNDAEIPEHLRPLVQSMAVLPTPTPAASQPIRLQIPALDLDAPVVVGDGWEQLKKGVGWHVGSGLPGELGNVVLSAHNDIYGELFRYLDQLRPGDQVIVYTNQRAFTYVVTDTQIVAPTQVEVMAATDEPVVTLISCYPYLVDNQRIVVRARLQSNQ